MDIRKDIVLLLLLLLLGLPVYAKEYKTLNLHGRVVTLYKPNVCYIEKSTFSPNIYIRVINGTVSDIYKTNEERDKVYNELIQWLGEK